MTLITVVCQWLSLFVLCIIVLFLLSLYVRGAFRWRSLFYIKDAIDPAEPQFADMLTSMTESLKATGRVTDVWHSVDDIQAARLSAINSAQRSILFETFMMTPGKRSEAFADAIAKRAIEGVTVQLLVDDYGTRTLDSRYWQRLRSAGAQVAFFNPFDWRAPANYSGRTHRKLLIIDGDRALIGGAGISDLWDGTEKADDTQPWLDIELAMTGKVVTILSTTFQKHWQGHRRLSPRKQPEVTAIDMGLIYPDLSSSKRGEANQCEAEQTAVKQIAARQSAVEESDAKQLPIALQYSKKSPSFIVTPGTKPSYRNSPIESLKQTLMASARQSIWLASPYFLPNESTRKLLIAAQETGVEVRILTTSHRSDKKPVYYASYEVYGSLLAAGISIFEYQPSMIHAKMLMVDHTWANTGSANLDYRSYLHNDELDILTNSDTLVRSVKQMFEQGFENSQKVSFSQWRQRSLVKHRLIGNVMRLIQWQL